MINIKILTDYNALNSFWVKGPELEYWIKIICSEPHWLKHKIDESVEIILNKTACNRLEGGSTKWLWSTTQFGNVMIINWFILSINTIFSSKCPHVQINTVPTGISFHFSYSKSNANISVCVSLTQLKLSQSNMYIFGFAFLSKKKT